MTGDGGKAGGREVQRTMLELLNQLDGFDSNTQVKVIAATNRPDVLDPALLRSGRLDRKIELPHPSEGKSKKNTKKINIQNLHTQHNNTPLCIIGCNYRCSNFFLLIFSLNVFFVNITFSNKTQNQHITNFYFFLSLVLKNYILIQTLVHKF